MRLVPSPSLAVLAVATLAVAVWANTGGSSTAQAPQRAPAAPAPAPVPTKPVPLTDARIKSFLAAQKDLDAIGENEPEASARAKQDAIAKKNGFADGAELDRVEESIEAVLTGIDGDTGKYVGAKTLLKRQIEEVKADKKMPAKERAAALKELNQALAEPIPEPPPGDIDVVVGHYKDIQAAMPQGDDKP